MADLTGSMIVDLRPSLSPAPVLAQVPRERPVSFVVLRRLGGPLAPPVFDVATIEATAWAATQPAAWDLIADVRRLVHGYAGRMVNGITVYRVDEFAGPGWSPDPDVGTPRYVMTFSIRHREHLTAS